MMTGFLKLLLACACSGLFFYSTAVFGFSTPLVLFPAFAVLLAVSIFYQPISFLAKNLSKGVAIISALLLALLMIAATIGGSFHLSPSNQVFAGLLTAISLVGFTSFFWNEDNTK